MESAHAGSRCRLNAYVEKGSHMNKQTMVIGLGQFGAALARSLVDRGVEVLAVDNDRDRVQYAAAFCAEAAQFDATDEQALARTAPPRWDLCVCAMGTESREAAIIVTALLRQMGAKRVVARATDEITARILSLVGAHEVVNPEEAFGERLAGRLVHTELLDQVPLGTDLVITEMRPLPAMRGKTLIELRLPNRFDITVVGTRRTVDGKATIVMPDPREAIKEDDILIVVAPPDAVDRALEKLG